jgi:CBS domain-containing protein
MKKVKNILQNKGSHYVSVTPDILVYDAIRVMGENKIGSVLVMERDKLVGILTERDYARKVVLQGRYSANTYVREIMTPHPGLTTVTPETSLEECMKLMTQRKIRHLPVLEENEVAGIVSIGDVLYTVIQEQELIIEDMTNYLYRR